MTVEIDRGDDEIRAKRTIRKSGNSLVITMPTEVLDYAELQDGDMVEVAIGFGDEDIYVRQTPSEKEP